MNDSITIDGVGPMPVERPATVAELCAIVRRCAESNTAIYPFGGGTMLDYGMPPARVGIALSTGDLNQVIDYPARDMTITVQAGITMQKLQEALAAEGQWLPIDVPDPENATIGGAIACDVSGPRRYGYGTFRDYVIGITAVNDRGEECKAGGRVVKNVAGYDLMKLYTGSLGTLGIITQVTLKVRPRPEEVGFVAVLVPEQSLSDLSAYLVQTTTRPTSMIVNNIARIMGAPGTLGSATNTWHAAIGFEGTDETFRWQCSQAESELANRGIQAESGPFDRDYRDEYSRELAGPPRDCEYAGMRFIRVRISTSSVVEYCLELISTIENCAVFADAASGSIYIGLSGREEHACQRDAADFARLQERAGTMGGNAVFERCPATWKKKLNIWGNPPADIALQKLIRAKFDPKRIFNPGRFVTDVF